MLHDNVYLEIKNKGTLRNLRSYKVKSDLYIAEDLFTMEVVDPDVDVVEGDICTLFVNGERELHGMIEAIEDYYDEGERYMVFSGRDLLGLLVDTYCDEFTTLQDLSLKEITERLIKNIKYINSQNIIYGKGAKDRAEEVTVKKSAWSFSVDDEFKFVQISPGQTIFEVLKNQASSRGMLLYSMPNGTIVFGQVTTSGKAEYNLISRKDGRGNNIKSGKRRRSISNRYSEVHVLGQQQGTDMFAAEDINFKGIVKDKSFPFYKPYYVEDESDALAPDRHAQLIMDKRLFEGDTIEYVMAGHGQQGRNYQPNTIAHVEDETFGISGVFLIHARTFEMNERIGRITTLSLSKPGLMLI